MKKVKRVIDNYKGILNLPHPMPSNRVPMPIEKRAAQFSPFSAVVGHESAVKEAARYTCQKKILDETEKIIIDTCLRQIENMLQKKEVVEIEIVYFKADKLKAGGQYLTKVSHVKKIDVYSQDIYFIDGGKINIEDIYTLMLL